MKQTRIIMGMPITVDIVGSDKESIYEQIFAYFNYVDETFSTYKINSEISKINRGEILAGSYSADMKEVFALSERTKHETKGFFNIMRPDGVYDPSGLVKGWSVERAATMLRNNHINNFYIEAGGDIAVHGKNHQGMPWRVGIRNPFNQAEIIKVVALEDKGIATSGNYIRGDHVYNPHQPGQVVSELVSLTVIGPTVYDADRFATAAFAMGKQGVLFVAGLPGYEAYAVDRQGMALFTDGFNSYVVRE